MATGSVTSSVTVSDPVESQTASKLTSEQHLIAKELSIPPNMLQSGAPLTLQDSYTYYLAYIKANEELTRIKAAGTWPSSIRLPGKTDIAFLFIGKSAYYQTWCKTFPHVSKHPDMVQWLQSDDDRKEDIEVWGEGHNIYNFQHLMKWLENDGSLVAGKKKEKKEKINKSHKAGSSKAGKK